MQIKITFDNKGIIDIPVNYNHHIQSAIFALLAEEDADYAKLLHDTAYGGTSKYKLFTFGSLKGKCRFHDKKLCFEGGIGLEIRSALVDFIEVLSDSMEQTGRMCIGTHTLGIKRMQVCSERIVDSVIRIRTATPIVAKCVAEDGKTIYYSPQDVRFLKHVRENFEHKYAARFGERPASSVDILPVGEAKKIVTRYKDIWVTAYHGEFQLCGEPEYLQFLYDVGLGSRTAQGFGMFDVL